MIFKPVIGLIGLLALLLPLHGYDFNSIPDMTWVKFGDGPRVSKTEFSTAFDHINNVWISGFGCGGGGAVPSCYSSDTYEFDPVTEKWTNTYPYQCRGSVSGNRPPARCSFGICFSSTHEVALMFSGANIGSTPDTWIYNAKTHTWTKKVQASVGGGYEGMRVVYDEVTDHFYALNYRPDQMIKYSLSTNQWVSTGSTGAPAATFCYAMAISESRRIILVISSEGGPEDHIYHIDDNRWYKLNSNYSAHGSRYRSGLVYDIANDVFLLMAGKNNNDDLWVLELNENSTSGTWTNILSKVTNYPSTWAGVKSTESLCYDRKNNVTWVNGHYRPTSAFRYKKGNSTRQIKFITHSPARPVLNCSPNPFTPFVNISVVPYVTKGKVNIYDLKGMLIRTFAYTEKNKPLVWDGTDISGQTMGCGRYIIKLDANDKSYSQHVTFIR